MTNEEILANRRNVYAAELGGNTNVIPLCEIEELLELARADERAKLSGGGVKVWVSWDEGNFESPTVTTKQPKANKDGNGRIYHTDLGQNFTISKEDAAKLNINQGECKAFGIRECL